MEEPRRTRNTMTTELPTYILFSDILPRLPAKSLTRFKCVSKQWKSLLETSDFSEIHLRHVTTDDHQNHHKFLFFSSPTTPPPTFHTLDCESPDHDGCLTAPRRSFPFKVSRYGKTTLIASFNGLVCIGVTKRWSDHVYTDMILWNPCTGDYKKLSKANSRRECFKLEVTVSGLYYSDSDDDYKLLRVTINLNAYIYSLKSNSWRKLDSIDDDLQSIGSQTWGPSIAQNEKLYFLKNGKRETIIRFDTKTEEFRKLQTPFSGDDDATICLNSVLLHKDRKVHLCKIHSCGIGECEELSAKLWRMDGDGEWTKVVNFLIPRKFYVFEPLHLMSNGNWATLCRSKCHVYNVDPDRDFEKISYRIDNPPTGKYIETLVSPNR